MASELLDAVAAPALVYAIILVLLTVDAFVPVVPTQALMISGGILTASGELRLTAVVAAGAAGALAGDLACFGLGRHRGRRDADGTARVRGKQRAITERLNELLRRRVFLAVLVCRFVPAGRMIIATRVGRRGYSSRRFVGYDLVAATLWASYAALLGRFGGEALTSASWLPLVLVGAAAVVFVSAAPVVSMVNRRRARGSSNVDHSVASTEPGYRTVVHSGRILAPALAPALMPAGAAGVDLHPDRLAVVAPDVAAPRGQLASL